MYHDVYSIEKSLPIPSPSVMIQVVPSIGFLKICMQKGENQNQVKFSKLFRQLHS